MVRSTAIRFALLVGTLALGGLGAALYRHHTALQRQAWDGDGRALYWQVRRTHHVHEPWELADQLSRRREEPKDVLDALDLQPGLVAADVGCGSGYYTTLLARALGPQGTLWSLDIQPESLELLRQRLAAMACEGCARVEVVTSSIDDTRLDEASVDRMLMSNIDFYAFRPLLPENVRMVDSAFRTLRPGGKLVVVQDLLPIPGGARENIPLNFEEAGFVLERQEKISKTSWLFELRRPET
jgi:ubiquinone/menaquinone biosynthesis C-methylase UbiE